VGEVLLLDDLTVDFSGGVSVVTGPSGAGKTTLLRLLVRLIEPTSGLVTYRGRPLADLPAPLLRRAVQLVGLRTTLLTERVGDEVRVAAPDLSRERVADLLAGVGLDPVEFAARGTEGLSAGQTQRLCLARSLALDPDVLLLDEPTAHLDAASTTVIETAIAGFAAAGGTVVVISHDAAQIARFGGATLMLKDGRAIL
jgi:putative ABC transport system ATP-binding protein